MATTFVCFEDIRLARILMPKVQQIMINAANSCLCRPQGATRSGANRRYVRESHLRVGTGQEKRRHARISGSQPLALVPHNLLHDVSQTMECVPWRRHSLTTGHLQHQSHLGPVKAVASQGKFLVSGGNDEEIRIYNIRKRCEVGSLMKHQAPITTLRFSKKANSLVSGSDDGMIAVWRIKDWECVSFKPAHKSSITDLDVHPSGKVLLSCGRDNTLRLWDLSSSKELFCRAQKGRGYGGFQQLRWRPRGEGFCYALGNDVSVFDSDGGDAVVRFAHPRPPFAFAYLSENTIATGGEDKIVRVWDIRTGRVATELSEFSSRIRSLIHEPVSRSLSVLGSVPISPTLWHNRLCSDLQSHPYSIARHLDPRLVL